MFVTPCIDSSISTKLYIIIIDLQLSNSVNWSLGGKGDAIEREIHVLSQLPKQMAVLQSLHTWHARFIASTNTKWYSRLYRTKIKRASWIRYARRLMETNAINCSHRVIIPQHAVSLENRGHTQFQSAHISHEVWSTVGGAQGGGGGSINFFDWMSW